MVNDELRKNENIRILDLMLKDFKPYVSTNYAPSNVIWGTLASKFEKSIREYGIDDVQSQEYNDNLGVISGFGSPITAGRTTDFDTMMWSIWNMLKFRDVHKIIQKTTPIPTKENLTLSTGKIESRPFHNREQIQLNWDYVFALDTILSISEEIPEILTQDVSICELGAGWGRIAHYLSQINPRIRYHIFDIPTTLVIGYTYLKNVNEMVSSYETSRLYDGVAIKEKGIHFMVSGDLEKTRDKQFDIFINQASFQEMSASQVNHYHEIIDRASKYFFNFQRYKDLDMDYSKYPRYENWVRIFDRDSRFNPIWFETMYKINE